MKLLYSKEENIGRIVLSNPPYNCLLQPEFENPETLNDFLSQPDLAGVVLTGDGRHFCAGADEARLDEMMRDGDSLGQHIQKGKALLDIIRFATVPVAAAIRGSCLGGGLEIALACHFRIGAGSAMFGFPESGRALMPGLGGTVYSQEIAFRGNVVDLVLSGRLIGAQEALHMGLIDASYAPKEVEIQARLFLRRLTEGRPVALVRRIMESIHNARRFSPQEALRRETKLFCLAARNAPYDR